MLENSFKKLNISVSSVILESKKLISLIRKLFIMLHFLFCKMSEFKRHLTKFLQHEIFNKYNYVKILFINYIQTLVL